MDTDDLTRERSGCFASSLVLQEPFLDPVKSLALRVPVQLGEFDRAHVGSKVRACVPRMILRMQLA